MNAPTSERLSQRYMDDGEFRLAARYWDGSLTLDLDGTRLEFSIVDGRTAGGPDAEPEPSITVSGPEDVWSQILAEVPPPCYNDILPARMFGLRVGGNRETFWQYYPAIRRLVDLLREDVH